MAKAEKKEKEKKETKKTTPKGGGSSYSAENIQVLEGLDPVRKRPGMYIGSTGADGLYHLIWEVVDNSIDEAMGGHATLVTIELLEGNTVKVDDNGRGIPVETHKQTKKSALETVMTTLHAGGKFGGEGYKVSTGLHGVGVSVVNALSSYMKVEVRREGGLYAQEYKKGVPAAKVKKVGAAKGTGTTVTFTPDAGIFAEMIQYDRNRILEHLRQQAYLTRGVTMRLIDRREAVPFIYNFHFEGGLLAFVRYLYEDHGEEKIIQRDVFYIQKESGGVEVEAAFVYTEDIETREMSFANNVYTVDGGMHLTGFRSALTRGLNDYARVENVLKEKDENLTGDDVREGMVAVVSVRLREPQFEGQTKGRLGSPEARAAVETVVGEALKEFLEKHPADARNVLEKCLLAAKARKAAKAAKDTVLRKGVLDGLTLPGKLADCITRKAEEAEIFIVEGDSAGGTAKQGRNRRYQAILPLRGKILNVEKARIDKMLASQEIRSLVIAMGTSIAETFDMEKLRYHKIVIMTDADVDGAHIRTLLLTLFYRYFSQVVTNGYLYVAQPPLYKINRGKEFKYAYSEEEKDEIMKDFAKMADKKGAVEEKKKEKEEAVGRAEGQTTNEDVEQTSTRGVNIQRYKGLGEMNADQLWETTMDPEKRILKKVTVRQAEEADKMFDILMGGDVEPRKRFIQTHALDVVEIDV